MTRIPHLTWRQRLSVGSLVVCGQALGVVGLLIGSIILDGWPLLGVAVASFVYGGGRVLKNARYPVRPFAVSTISCLAMVSLAVAGRRAESILSLSWCSNCQPCSSLRSLIFSDGCYGGSGKVGKRRDPSPDSHPSGGVYFDLLVHRYFVPCFDGVT